MKTILAKTCALSLVAFLLLIPSSTAASITDGMVSKRASSSGRAGQKRPARKRARGAKAPAKVTSAAAGLRESVRELATVADRRLDGAFIQFWGDRVQQKWHRVLTAMQAAGMKTIILQYLKNRPMRRNGDNVVYDANGCAVMDEADFTYTDRYTMPNGDVIIDPTRFILDFADEHGMEVYVGLINDERFVTYGQWDKPQCLNLPNQIKDNTRFAEVVWGHYGKKPGSARTRPSFKGWYLPQEMWNEAYTDDQLKGFRSFFAAVSASCKKLSGGLPVAVSPFFNPKILSAEAFAETYGRFLKSGHETAGIDIVMLQDSVGAKEIAYDDIPAVAGGYYGAMRRKLDALGLRFWGNVESFVGERPGRPTEIGQLERQIETASAHVSPAEKLVTFDFYHYMNPFGYVHENDPAHVAAERLLYCEYLKKYVPGGAPPPGVNCAQ
jgi:hypothetical protein